MPHTLEKIPASPNTKSGFQASHQAKLGRLVMDKICSETPEVMPPPCHDNLYDLTITVLDRSFDEGMQFAVLLIYAEACRLTDNSLSPREPLLL